MPAPSESRRRTLKALLAALTLMCLAPAASAHNILGHAPPLDVAAVERVVGSLETLFNALNNAGLLGDVRPPDGAINLAALLGPLEETVASLDETSIGESLTLQRALRGAGYSDSPIMIDEWRFETRETLIAWEQLQTLPADEVHDGEIIELFLPELNALLTPVTR